MNLAPDDAKQYLIRNAHTLRHANRSLSLRGAIRLACDIAPGIARAAGLHTTAAVVYFANSASGSGSGSGSSTAATPARAEIANSNQDFYRLKIAARDRVNAAARSYCDKFKVDYQTAYHRILTDPQFANDVAQMKASPTIPAITTGTALQANMSGEVAALMGIRGDFDDAEIKTVFSSIGKNLTPDDLKNIWTGLKNYWAGKDTGLSPTDQEIFLRSRFPALTAKLVSLNILQANNSPDSPAASAFAKTLKQLGSSNS